MFDVPVQVSAVLGRSKMDVISINSAAIPEHLLESELFDGATLCHRKSFWLKIRFPASDVGQDTRFVFPRRAPVYRVPDLDQIGNGGRLR